MTGSKGKEGLESWKNSGIFFLSLINPFTQIILDPC